MSGLGGHRGYILYRRQSIIVDKFGMRYKIKFIKIKSTYLQLSIEAAFNGRGWGDVGLGFNYLLPNLP